MRTAYIPHQSPLIITKTEDEISHDQTQRNVLMCGDLHAGTGTEPGWFWMTGQTYTWPLLHISTGTLTTEMDTAAIMSHIESVHGQWSASRGIL